MNIFIAETIGTALLILLGNGVVAACCLKNTKSGPAGWMVITTAWAFAVYVGVIAAKALGSGAHINPAVTLAFAVNGNIGWDLVAPYIGGQFLGAIIGALLVWIHYLDHFAVTLDEDAKRACSCTYIAGASLTLPGETAATPVGLGSIDALPVAITVWAIGLSLGATTGYAINPARDLGPRIVLACVPLRTDPDWAYSWVPVLGPCAGGVLAAVVFKALS